MWLLASFYGIATCFPEKVEKLSSLIRKTSCGHRSTLQQSVTVPKKSDTTNKNEKFLELVRHTLLCSLQCVESFFVHGCSFVASFFIESFFVAYFIASFFVESFFICLCFIPFVCFYIFLAELKQLWQEGFNKLIKDLLKLNVRSDVKKTNSAVLSSWQRLQKYPWRTSCCQSNICLWTNILLLSNTHSILWGGKSASEMSTLGFLSSKNHLDWKKPMGNINLGNANLFQNAILDGCSTVDSKLDYDGIGWYSMVLHGTRWYFAIE